MRSARWSSVRAASRSTCPARTPSGARCWNPGETTLDARQVVALLGQRSEDAALRFQGDPRGSARGGALVECADFAESDDAGGAAAILGTAAGATVDVAPSQRVADTVVVPSQPDFDEMMASHFGTTTPIRAIVQNGSGAPGCGRSGRRAAHRPPGSASRDQRERRQLRARPNRRRPPTASITRADANLAQTSLGVGTVVVSEGSIGVRRRDHRRREGPRGMTPVPRELRSRRGRGPRRGGQTRDGRRGARRVRTTRDDLIFGELTGGQPAPGQDRDRGRRGSPSPARRAAGPARGRVRRGVVASRLHRRRGARVRARTADVLRPRTTVARCPEGAMERPARAAAGG